MDDRRDEQLGETAQQGDPADAYAGDSDTSIGTRAGGDSSEDFGGERVSTAARSGEETWTPGATETGGRGAAGREMLAQLQQMIDALATQAAPVMREVAAKAAELAALAGEKAGPIAHKAAGVTETVGQRVATRSKEVAEQLRRPADGAGAAQPETAAETGSDTEGAR